MRLCLYNLYITFNAAKRSGVRKMLVSAQSILSGDVRTKDLPVTMDQMSLWRSGELIQKAMPDLSPIDRDFIKGIFEDELDQFWSRV